MSVFSITYCKLSVFFAGMQTAEVHFSICSQHAIVFQSCLHLINML